jgi:hypothetical protein
MGKASMPANSLNSSALPSITGRAASGPMSPRPSTAVPSVTMATLFFLMVSLWTSSGSLAIALQIRATPACTPSDRSARSFSGMRERTSILPPSCSRNVRSRTLFTAMPSRAPTTWAISSAWLSLRASTLTSWTMRAVVASTMSRAVMLPPAVPMAVASRPSVPGSFPTSTRIRTEYAALVAAMGGNLPPAAGCPAASEAAGSRPYGVSSCCISRSARSISDARKRR